MSPTSMVWASLLFIHSSVPKDSMITHSVPGLVLGDRDEQETTDRWETDRQMSRECMMRYWVLGHLLQPSFHTFGYSFYMHL